MDEAIHDRWQQFRDLPNHPEMSVFPDREPVIRNEDVLEGGETFDCPKCGYSLIGIRADYCPECGIAVDYEPVTVFTAADLSLVWAAAMVMDQAAISNMIVTGSFDPIIGLFTSRSSMPHLMVPFKFIHEATALLEKQFGSREFGTGERPAAQESGPDWTCSHCGERNPGTFEVCWQCGQANGTGV